MRILVTTGNTAVDIDRVRCITNIFSGRTGAKIALAAHARGHHVRLLASQPGVLQELGGSPGGARWELQPYRTFDDLSQQLAGSLRGGWDALIHAAAISDYTTAGIYATAPGVVFDPGTAAFQAAGEPAMVDIAAGKVKSDHEEVWLRMTKLPKLVDLVRGWGFAGVLVKFKLEVGLSDEALLAVAERSRAHSQAELMVANTLEGSRECAFVGHGPGTYQRIERPALPDHLLARLEALHAARHPA